MSYEKFFDQQHLLSLANFLTKPLLFEIFKARAKLGLCVKFSQNLLIYSTFQTLISSRMLIYVTPYHYISINTLKITIQNLLFNIKKHCSQLWKTVSVFWGRAQFNLIEIVTETKNESNPLLVGKYSLALKPKPKHSCSIQQKATNHD